MESLVTAIDRGAGRLAAFIDWFGIAFLVLSAAVAFASVVLRYGFGESDQMIEEISRYSILFACFLLVGPALFRGQHIAVDVLSNTLPAKTHRYWEFAQRAIFLLVVAVLFWSGVIWVSDQYRYGLTIFGSSTPAWIPAISVPLGMGVAVLFGISEVITSLYVAITGKPLKECPNDPVSTN